MKLFLILFGIIFRLLPHLPNFSPLAGAALFSGAKFDKKSAIFTTLTTLAVSDYLLLYINPFAKQIFNFHRIYPITAMFHSTTLFVWSSFIFAALSGFWLKKRKSPNYIIVGSMAASLQFFLITNFGVWATGMYNRGLDGLMQSYIMGLPFLKWTIAGDFFYTTLFFGAYEFAQRFTHKQKLISQIKILSETEDALR